MPDPAAAALALGITALAVVVLGRVAGAVRAATVPSLIVGRDGRASTTTTVAAVWTTVVVWFAVALAFRRPSSWRADLDRIDPVSVALVAAPLATAWIARLVVTVRIARGRLQKPVALTPRWADVVSDDDGRADLVDLQYVLFNGVAVAVLVIRFVSGTHAPLPVPLVALTWLPGAVLLAAELLHRTAPVLTTATPTHIRPGDRFTVFGRNLLAGTAGADARLSATVNGRDALVVLACDTSAVILMPGLTPGLTPTQPGPVSVRVVTAGGAVAALPFDLSVLPADPPAAPSAPA